MQIATATVLRPGRSRPGSSLQGLGSGKRAAIAEQLPGDPEWGSFRPASLVRYVRAEGFSPPLIEVGGRLADLAPRMRVLAGSRLTIDAEIACPRSLVRMDGEEFDSVMLVLIANAVAAGARNITVRSHTAGRRVWIQIGDDGCDTNLLRALQAFGSPGDGSYGAVDLSLVRNFTRKTHGHLRVRARPGIGTCFALVLPTVLSVAENLLLSQPEEKIHEKNRQSIAA